MDKELKTLLQQGEGVALDYKESITNANKIAKTLSAFSNTTGGILLVGIKDNKTICGIAPEEEKFMINLAAEKYCKPKPKLTFSQFEHDGKSILKVTIAKGSHPPYKAKDEKGKWKAYLRIEDSTMLASLIWYKSAILLKKGLGTFSYTHKSKWVSDFIILHGKTTLQELIEQLPLSKQDICNALILLIYLGEIKIEYIKKQEFYVSTK
jgi:hypothetical protein